MVSGWGGGGVFVVLLVCLCAWCGRFIVQQSILMFVFLLYFFSLYFCSAAGARVVTTRCQFSFNVQMGCFGMGQSTSIMATDCIFCYNNQKGLFVCRSAVANVYGDRTESFSNKIGLSAIEGGSIYLHLTELNQHQTSYFHNNRVVDKESKDTSISETSGLIQFCCLCHYCIQRRKY